MLRALRLNPARYRRNPAESLPRNIEDMLVLDRAISHFVGMAEKAGFYLPADVMYSRYEEYDNDPFMLALAVAIDEASSASKKGDKSASEYLKQLESLRDAVRSYDVSIREMMDQYYRALRRIRVPRRSGLEAWYKELTAAREAVYAAEQEEYQELQRQQVDAIDRGDHEEAQKLGEALYKAGDRVRRAEARLSGGI